MLVRLFNVQERREFEKKGVHVEDGHSTGTGCIFSASSLSCWNRTEDKYLSPKLGCTVCNRMKLMKITEIYRQREREITVPRSVSHCSPVALQVSAPQLCLPRRIFLPRASAKVKALSTSIYPTLTTSQRRHRANDT